MALPDMIIDATLRYMVPALLGSLAGVALTWLTGIRKDREIRNMTTRMVCRLVIYNDRFDVDEKIEAYKVYSAPPINGNHRTKSVMDDTVGEDVDVYISNHCK